RNYEDGDGPEGGIAFYDRLDRPAALTWKIQIQNDKIRPLDQLELLRAVKKGNCLFTVRHSVNLHVRSAGLKGLAEQIQIRRIVVHKKNLRLFLVCGHSSPLSYRLPAM